MIPYEVDPSLHNDKPEKPLLDDGFSPPDPDQPTPPPPQGAPAPHDGVSDPWGQKSGF
ncbi:hypothetical protein GCM10027034_16460 [Ramlibacter solisilvae]|uniref:hypothetical protein n=1 Tax=Ramlibacter tataouinensis TaxID=94132 RepID=UPI001314024D|nr:hypothetical protein [Ramlibacter tataouinensis]